MTEPVAVTYTSKLGLLVPGFDDELTACRPNWDKLDNTYTGAIWVAPGVTPEDNLLFEGALIAEYSTGKVWRATRNSSGMFQKKWVKYPWLFSGDTSNYPYGSTAITPNQQFGCLTTNSMCINAGIADLSGDAIVIPENGIYTGVFYVRYELTAGAVNHRSATLLIDGVSEYSNHEVTKQGATYPGGYYSMHNVRFTRKFVKGTN